MRSIATCALLGILCACAGPSPSLKSKSRDADSPSVADGGWEVFDGSVQPPDRDARAVTDGEANLPDGMVTNPPVPVVADCAQLPAPGTFENILPPGVSNNFAFAVDPVHLGTVYLGTDTQKIWKTTDCGATWRHINTGKNGDEISGGMNWTFIVDPVEPETLYTNSGYNRSTNGAYRSRNGGVDWDLIWPPSDGQYADLVDNDFANTFAMDPRDHRHLLLTFHAPCNPPFAESCIAETFDGGDTFQIVNGDVEMVGTEGQVIYFLDNAKTWLWASQSSDFWRTDDGGASWIRITPALHEAHPQGSQLIRATDGTFYVATSDGVARSEDGKSWKLMEGTGPLAGGLVSDGKTIYMSNAFYWNWGTDLHPYFTAPESEGAPWTQMSITQSFTAGGSLGLDPAHRVLYSSNLGNGFWRLVLPN